MANSDSPLRSIFADALEIDDDQQRAAFLSRACGTDAALRRGIEELIKANSQAGRFLPDQPGASDAQALLLDSAEALAPPASRLQVAITEKSGDLIGRYKLLQKIGEGGCGVVYMAEQEEPIRRKVALKVIKLGMDTKSVVARFEAERQALALMDHPNIAKVLDAGATETGRPFFVMELVRGIKITHYSDQHKLSTRDRLELFIQVCQAVQHAHQKGIIHRDLKPSNILVTVNDSVAVPKVIDFGIAKATEGRLADQTLFTAFEQFVGTPAYMSPEQAAMTSLDIDTRSDIYSLGVLLYELLTSKTPFDTRELVAAGLDELRRTIREREPSRPSTRLSTMLDGELTTSARQRGIEAPKLIQLLRGDLDWIVMKCLEKDRGRRYETANGLAMDIQRHLNSEVVVARPPSTLYRFQRVVRRNKLPFAAGLVIALVLLAGTAVSTWQAVRAGRERQRVLRNVVRQYVANGTRLMNEGDLFASLLWYTEALRLDAGDVRREEPHRIRIASVLRQCPKLLNVFSHGKMLYRAEFSPDGSKVVTASDDHTARVWDATTGAQLHQLQHDDEVYDASFSRDGLRIVTSSRDKTARIWDSRTGALLRKLPHPDTVWRAWFSPEGRLLATASEDHAVHLWNALTGAPVAEPLRHDHQVDNLSFSPDGHFLAAIMTGHSTACIWEVTSTPRLIKKVAHNGNFADIAFSPDGRHFLTGDHSNLRVWELNSLQEAPFSPLKQADSVQCLGFSPDGQTIMSGGDDGTTRLWDAASGRQLFVPIARQTTEVNTARFSPDGRRIVTAGADGIARFWNARTGQAVSPPLKHILYVKSALISVDGRRLLANSCDQAARVWDMATGDFPGPPPPVFENEHRLLSPNNQYQLSKGESNIVWIVDARSGRRLARLSHTNDVTYMSFSRDGRSVLTASEENCAVSSKQNEIFLWEVPGGRRVHTTNMALSFLLMYTAFSPDNSRLLTCGFDYNARLWDAHTGQPLSDLLRHRERVPWGAFSPDGHSVVTASLDRTARVWDAANGKPLTAPLQHRATVIGAFWSADGKRLHTITEDEHLQVWDLASGEPLTPPRRIHELAGPSVPPRMSAPVQANGDLPPDGRPVADLVLLSQMLALGRIDPDGSVVPLQLRDLTSAWHFLRDKYPEQFVATPSEVAEWHYREAQESDAEGNPEAALFHLDRVMERQPQDQVLRQERAEEAAALLQKTNLAVYQASLSKRIPARDLKAGSEQIDLATHYNLALQDSLDQNANHNNFASLPSGLQTLGGVHFDVRGVIHLNGLEAKQAGQVYPERVNDIRIGRKCLRLHFLHATALGAEKGGTVVGSYVLHYADGQSRELPIVFGRDVADWWLPNKTGGVKEPGNSAPVWTGSNRWSAKNNCAIALYRTTHENPRPEIEAVSIDFVSSMSAVSPFLIGLTVD